MAPAPYAVLDRGASVLDKYDVTPPLCHADPAADAFSYPVAFDVRDLVTLEDVMEEMELGPNG